MEKEQKKLLLVAVSVGVFLLVTVTVAIILVNQRTIPQEASITWTAPQPVQVTPITPADNNQINNAADINVNIDCDDSEVTVTIDRNEGDQLVIQIPTPAAPAVPDTAEIVAIAPPATPQVTAPATARPAQPTQPAQTQSTAPRATSTTQTPRATTQQRTVNDYWIQTGAFTARVRAEDVRDSLAEKGLVSIIENREINGQIWYRVRLGPYTSQREADYWLSLVKSIDGFGDSQVRQTTRMQ